jgi:hypothetical protein
LFIGIINSELFPDSIKRLSFKGDGVFSEVETKCLNIITGMSGCKTLKCRTTRKVKMKCSEYQICQ